MAPRVTRSKAAHDAATNTPEGASGTAGTAPSAGSGEGAIEAPSGTQSAPPTLPETEATERRRGFPALCLVSLNGETFEVGATLTLTRDQQTALRAAFAIAEDWPD